MANHVPTIGRVVGQRCLDCKGAVKWQAGGRPGHVYAQDFIGTGTIGQGHPVALESGEPNHYWLGGRNGATDVKFDADVPVQAAQDAIVVSSDNWNAAHADDIVDTDTWQPPTADTVNTWVDCQPRPDGKEFSA